MLEFIPDTVQAVLGRRSNLPTPDLLSFPVLTDDCEDWGCYLSPSLKHLNVTTGLGSFRLAHGICFASAPRSFKSYEHTSLEDITLTEAGVYAGSSARILCVI